MFHDQNSAEKLPKKNKLFNVAVGEESNKAIGMVATDMFISLYLNVPKMKNHEKTLSRKMLSVSLNVDVEKIT